VILPTCPRSSSSQWLLAIGLIVASALAAASA
jgi:hypothetical protein